MATKPSKPKARMGRPTKYKPQYCQMLIDHMSTGKAFESFAASVDTSIRVTYEWRDQHPDFQQAYERGQAKSMAVWEALGMKGLTKPGSISASIWGFNMRCRFRNTEFRPQDKGTGSDGNSGSGGGYDGFDI